MIYRKRNVVHDGKCKQMTSIQFSCSALIAAVRAYQNKIVKVRVSHVQQCNSMLFTVNEMDFSFFSFFFAFFCHLLSSMLWSAKLRGPPSVGQQGTAAPSNHPQHDLLSVQAHTCYFLPFSYWSLLNQSVRPNLIGAYASWGPRFDFQNYMVLPSPRPPGNLVFLQQPLVLALTPRLP